MTLFCIEISFSFKKFFKKLQFCFLSCGFFLILILFKGRRLLNSLFSKWKLHYCPGMLHHICSINLYLNVHFTTNVKTNYYDYQTIYMAFIKGNQYTKIGDFIYFKVFQNIALGIYFKNLKKSTLLEEIVIGNKIGRGCISKKI